MEPHVMAQRLAGGRVAIGVLLLLFPGRVFKGTVGDAAGSRAFRMVARMLGARDVMLGVGPLVAAQRKEPVRPWLSYGAVSDAVDAVAVLVAYRHLRPWHRFLVLGAALSGATTGAYLASAIEE